MLIDINAMEPCAGSPLHQGPNVIAAIQNGC